MIGEQDWGDKKIDYSTILGYPDEYVIRASADLTHVDRLIREHHQTPGPYDTGSQLHTLEEDTHENPRFIDAMNTGITLFNHGHYDAAMNQFSATREAGSNVSVFWHCVGRVHFAKGKQSVAAEKDSHAIALKHFTYSRYCYENALKYVENNTRSYTKPIRCNQNYAVVYAGLAAALVQIKWEEEAFDMCAKSLVKNPKYVFGPKEIALFYLDQIRDIESAPAIAADDTRRIQQQQTRYCQQLSCFYNVLSHFDLNWKCILQEKFYDLKRRIKH